MANPFDKKRWLERTLRPQWSAALDTLRNLLAPYEEVFAEVLKTNNEADLNALLEILQTSGALAEPMRIAGVLPLQIERQIFAEFLKARNERDINRQRALFKERNEAFKTMDKIVEQAPLLMKFFLAEAALSSNTISIAHLYVHNLSTTQDAIASIQKDYPKEVHTIMRNGLNVIIAGKHAGDMRKMVVGDNFAQNVALYTSFDFGGCHSMSTMLFDKKVICDIKTFSNKQPFIFCRARLKIEGYPEMIFGISRFGGKLLLQGTNTVRINGLCNNENFEHNIEQIVWWTIMEGIEKNVLKEVQVISSAVPQVEAGAILSDSGQHAELEKNDVADKPSPEEAQIIQVQESAAVQEDVMQKRVHIPPLTYRQFTRALVRCGAKIVPGGKHLKIEANGQSTTMFNPHNQTERYFYSPAVHEKLAALHIDPSLFLERNKLHSR